MRLKTALPLTPKSLNTMERKCMDCGKKLQGRVDKKFCNDHCRNNFYNRKHRDLNASIRKVNGMLKANRNILKSLNPNGKAKVTKEALLVKGFNFKYFTNIYKTRKGHTYFFCYDQGYLPIGNDHFTLVEKQDYVDG